MRRVRVVVRVLVSRLVATVSSGAALSGRARGGRVRRGGRRGRRRLGLAVRLVRLDDLVLGLGALGAGLGALDLHLERGALRVGFGARRHAARLVRLLYVGIEVYDEVADADVPLVVIVLEVGGVRVGRGASSAGRRALPHWRRHPRRLAAPTATRFATNTIVDLRPQHLFKKITIVQYYTMGVMITLRALIIKIIIVNIFPINLYCIIFILIKTCYNSGTKNHVIGDTVTILHYLILPPGIGLERSQDCGSSA